MIRPEKMALAITVQDLTLCAIECPFYFHILLSAFLIFLKIDYTGLIRPTSCLFFFM